MSDQERLEKFRAVLLMAMNLFRQTRKDIMKLQIQIVALRDSFARLDPQWGKHFGAVLRDVETSLADQKSAVDAELEKELNDVIDLLSLDKKRVN
jgi:hypothetical protein